MERFSKKALALWVIRREKYYETTYGFHKHNGWAQVDGKSAAIQRAYGAYDELESLRTAFDLSIVNTETPA